jgi:hypothetical protein
MPRFWLLGVIGLCACSGPEFKQQRLQDGSLQIECDLAMDECVRRAQDLCNYQRFRILEGTSETRVSDVPPFERAHRTSRLHLKCTNDGAQPLLSLDSPPAAPAAAKAAAPRTCAAGETRVCVGPAACKGGQTCLADGSAFGPCDCGPMPPPVSTPANAPIAPAEPSSPVSPATPTQ